MAVLLCALYHQREYKSDGFGVTDFVERCWVKSSGLRALGGGVVSRIPIRRYSCALIHNTGRIAYTQCSLQALR